MALAFYATDGQNLLHKDAMERNVVLSIVETVNYRGLRFPLHPKDVRDVFALRILVSQGVFLHSSEPWTVTGIFSVSLETTDESLAMASEIFIFMMRL